MKQYIKGLIAALALILCLCACGKGEEPAQTTTDTGDTTETTVQTEPQSTDLDLIKDGKSEFTVIRPDMTSDAMVSGASNFMNAIRKKTGTMLKLSSDWYSDREEAPDLSGPEILVGATNRPETTEVLASLPANSYTVTRKNNKIVIVGSDNNLTTMAMIAFTEKVLNNPDRCGEGFLKITEEDEILITLDGPVTMKLLIESNYKLVASSKKVVQTDRQGDYRIGQGACSDGTYVYFVLRNSNDSGSVITKHLLANGTFIGVSDVLDLGHGNDATFDTKNNRIVIAHGQSEGRILTLVDPDTLKLIKDINIPEGSGAITYSVERDQYAISQGGSTLHMLTSDFKWISTRSRTDSTGYTAQGMGSDENYIYFPMSGKNDNKLVVYNWDSKYVTTLTIPVSHESESMFWVNGRYYIAYNTAGEALYETTFEILYQ